MPAWPSVDGHLQVSSGRHRENVGRGAFVSSQFAIRPGAKPIGADPGGGGFGPIVQ